MIRLLAVLSLSFLLILPGPAPARAVNGQPPAADPGPDELLRALVVTPFEPGELSADLAARRLTYTRRTLGSSPPEEGLFGAFRLGFDPRPTGWRMADSGSDLIYEVYATEDGASAAFAAKSARMALPTAPILGYPSTCPPSMLGRPPASTSYRGFVVTECAVLVGSVVLESSFALEVAAAAEDPDHRFALAHAGTVHVARVQTLLREHGPILTDAGPTPTLAPSDLLDALVSMPLIDDELPAGFSASAPRMLAPDLHEWVYRALGHVYFETTSKAPKLLGGVGYTVLPSDDFAAMAFQAQDGERVDRPDFEDAPRCSKFAMLAVFTTCRVRVGNVIVHGSSGPDRVVDASNDAFAMLRSAIRHLEHVVGHLELTRR